MNTNCLVTKLKGSVSDQNLMKLNELRIYIISGSAGDIQNFHAKANDNGGLTTTPIFGTTWYDGSVTPKTCNAGGYVRDYGVSGSVISIDNKYNLKTIGLSSRTCRINLIGDLNQLEYCTDLEGLQFFNNGNVIPDDYAMCGNMSSLAALTNLKYLSFTGGVEKNVKGNIDSLINCTSLELLETSIGGHLSTTTNMNSLQKLMLSSSAKWERYSGNLNEIGGVSTLQELNLAGNTEIYGDIADLSNHTELTNIDLHGVDMTHITGSLESLVAGMSSRTTGTLKIVCCSNITLNGVEVGNNVTKTYDFSTSTWS